MTRRVKIARTTRKLRRLKRARANPPPGGLRPTENDKARTAGIPKSFKQYQARYGKGGVDAIVAGHLQNPAPMLDHGRDRAEKNAEYLESEFGVSRREGMAPGRNPEEGSGLVGSIPTSPTTITEGKKMTGPSCPASRPDIAAKILAQSLSDKA